MGFHSRHIAQSRSVPSGTLLVELPLTTSSPAILDSGGTDPEVVHARVLPNPFRAPTVPPECSDRVTVGAHKIALRQFSQNLVARATPKPTEFAQLLEAWAMIPLHNLREKHLSAVSTWPVDLEAC